MKTQPTDGSKHPHPHHVVKASLRDNDVTIMQSEIIRKFDELYTREYIVVDGMLFRRIGRLMDEVVYNKVPAEDVDVLPLSATQYTHPWPDMLPMPVVLKQGNEVIKRTTVKASNPPRGAMLYAGGVFVLSGTLVDPVQFVYQLTSHGHVAPEQGTFADDGEDVMAGISAPRKDNENAHVDNQEQPGV